MILIYYITMLLLLYDDYNIIITIQQAQNKSATCLARGDRRRAAAGAMRAKLGPSRDTLIRKDAPHTLEDSAKYFSNTCIYIYICIICAYIYIYNRSIYIYIYIISIVFV